MRQHALAAALLVLVLTTLPVSASQAPAPAALPAATTASSAGTRPTPRSECAELALSLALVQARSQKRELDSGVAPDAVLGSPGLILTEYAPGRGCKVTLTLPLERLRSMKGTSPR